MKSCLHLKIIKCCDNRSSSHIFYGGTCLHCGYMESTFEPETKKHVWNVDHLYDNYASRLHMALRFSIEIHTD